MYKRLYAISSRHDEMVKELAGFGIFSSEGDVVRQAIALLYEKINPKKQDEIS